MELEKLTGQETDKLTVALPEMLAARERRLWLQQALLNEYPGALICFTLNIPGPVKLLPGVTAAFETACTKIRQRLADGGLSIRSFRELREKTGPEAFFCVTGTPLAVKALLIPLEDHTRIGRLYDIDVLGADGVKVSREELGMAGRKCLLCGEPAQVCARSRRHSVPELTAEVCGILAAAAAPSPAGAEQAAFTSRMSAHLMHALMAEVEATPKPGLVDLHDNGAHQDMDPALFRLSSAAIVPYLSEMAKTGYLWEESKTDCGKAAAPFGLFEAIRPIGMEAEKAMFAATGGVNTHKGMIFSMGITAAVCGWQYQNSHAFRPEEALLLCGRITSPALSREFDRLRSLKPKTHGEILYAKSGVRGIRGEVMDGFPSIRTVALPALRAAQKSGASPNAARLDTLLALMSNVDDTNILTRTSPEHLAYVRDCALKIRRMGSAADPKVTAALKLLNLDFIRKNLSPGGCADLLAVTILLDSLERSFGTGKSL